MAPETILQADILDIIFEGRNKAYGAYTLRKTYNKRLLLALIPVLGFLVLLFSFQSYKKAAPQSNKGGLPPVVDTIVLIDIIEPPPPPKPPVVQAQVASIDYTTPVISSTDFGTIPTIDDLSKAVQIATESVPGIDAIGPPIQAVSVGPALAEPIAEPVEPAAFTTAERMPEFPGGKAALYRFLAKHLKVPEGNLAGGQRIKQLVKFVVQADGLFTEIKFIESGGPEFEKEVLRVIRKMPKWTPGYQNGTNVPVFFTIPVIFEVPEE